MYNALWGSYILAGMSSSGFLLYPPLCSKSKTGFLGRLDTIFFCYQAAVFSWQIARPETVVLSLILSYISVNLPPYDKYHRPTLHLAAIVKNQRQDIVKQKSSIQESCQFLFFFNYNIKKVFNCNDLQIPLS